MMEKKSEEGTAEAGSRKPEAGAPKEKKAGAPDTRQTETARLAVVRVRGRAFINHKIEETLAHLNLKTVNKCVILDSSPTLKGMVEKVNNWVTWGEVDAETEKMLGEGSVFSLNSPKKGYGREGVKKSYKASGALGYRGGAINNLIRRML